MRAATTEKEREFLQLIRESKDPVKATEIAIDIIARVIAGEDGNSIMARYGVDWEAVKSKS